MHILPTKHQWSLSKPPQNLNPKTHLLHHFLADLLMGFEFSPASPAGKWLGFVTAVWVQAISGNNYTFSNYSDAIKSLMGLTQLQLNSLSVAKDVGKAFGLLAGLASDRLPPPVLLLIGSIEGFIAYGVQWLVVSRRIQPLPYWAVSINYTMWIDLIRH